MNPKDELGHKKARLSPIPAPVLFEMGLALSEGARKYGRHNWRITGVRASIYYDAALRHIMAWWEGQNHDSDSGQHHLAHALACLVILRDAERAGKLDDDRPPVTEDLDWLMEMNISASELVEKYPNARKPLRQSDGEQKDCPFPDWYDPKWVEALK